MGQHICINDDDGCPLCNIVGVEGSIEPEKRYAINVLDKDTQSYKVLMVSEKLFQKIFKQGQPTTWLKNIFRRLIAFVKSLFKGKKDGKK